MAKSVQFRNAESAVEAFDNTGVSAWSVWQDKQMLYKGIGKEDLEEFLKLLADSSTNAIYTIRYYEDITDKSAIKSNTADDGSFNFRLNSDGMEITNAQYSRFNNSNELISKVGALENKFEKLMERLEEEPDEDEKPKSALGVIGEILSNPAISPMIPTLLQTLFGLGQTQNNYRPLQPAIVGNVPAAQMPAQQYQQPVMKVENENQSIVTDNLDETIKALQLYDPKFSEHMQKLLNIAQHDKGVFAMILANFDGYQMK